MIDLNPSDMSCIYSTLKFVCDHAKRYGFAPVLTFDQPLYWKALTIIENEPEDSSGLEDVLELIYAKNAVTHMLTGKAISRAIRGHLLVNSALNAMLASKTYDITLPTKSNEVEDPASDPQQDAASPLDTVVEKMRELEAKHPSVYESFQEGFHVARRSNRHWAGLSTDLMIEQVLMRSVKTSGGLTRGKGLTETQRLVWLMSMPACAEVNDAMQSLTGVRYRTSEQHKDSTEARKARGYEDTLVVLDFLTERNPFSQDTALRCITTGVTAEEQLILLSMKGKNTTEYTFRKKEEAVTLASKISVKVGDSTIQIDPQLLFQRLSFVATGGNYGDPKAFFEYEMCSFPPLLFDSSLLLRKAKKPVLADAIWVRYVDQRYKQATVVFYGYESGPSTKDSTHQRRSSVCGPSVEFDGKMADIFHQADAAKNDIAAAGETDLLCLYKGLKDETLDSLRYARFCQKISTGNTQVQPESLPPTSAAAIYHSLRVYHQVQQWRGIALPPEDWGWKEVDGKLQPQRTDQSAAHPSLLELIRCNSLCSCLNGIVEAVYHSLRVYQQVQQWRGLALPPEDCGLKEMDGKLPSQRTLVENGIMQNVDKAVTIPPRLT
ncbi:predicted protein [Nematostella vectensis]|uniref:Uncharacterized protein n=1 Tax=Nematostella vectensis TaxID=45351 RepID=A7SX45_NEMVE|nr:predicted protein [Nematostella vectensis]|eukprot:XP_001623825.1 predicted protein [Nematostella vectensis]